MKFILLMFSRATSILKLLANVAWREELHAKLHLGARQKLEKKDNMFTLKAFFLKTLRVDTYMELNIPIRAVKQKPIANMDFIRTCNQKGQSYPLPTVYRGRNKIRHFLKREKSHS